MSCKVTLMEDPLKQYKFPSRRVLDFSLLSCFLPSRRDKLLRSAPGSPSSTSSNDDEFFSDDEPDLVTTDSSSECTDTTTQTSAECAAKLHTGGVRILLMSLSDQSTSPLMPDAAGAAIEESFVFSPPALADNVVETPYFRPLSDPLLSTFSYDCAMATGPIMGLPWVSVGRSSATNLDRGFCGRPQPLLPARLGTPNSKISGANSVWLPLPAPQNVATHSGNGHGSALSSADLKFNSGASSVVSTSSQSSLSSLASSDRGEIGSWSTRRGKKAPVGGLPLPPPSVATQLLPELQSYEFEELMDATQEFAPECCMEKGEFGAVYRAWMKPATSTELGLKIEAAVVRPAAKENQTLKEWKSDVQMLAQLPDMNICLIQGYCVHEDVKSEKGRRMERLLVFEQSPNGNLHDYLCGSRSKTHLDWATRISIVLGAARGLLYLHDRAPVRILYREFKASSVLLDKDYMPRLAGYGLTVTSAQAATKSSSTTVMKKSQAHAKTNVWSFGIVVLELLTGKHSRDSSFMCDEKHFVRWAAPFLKEESKLLHILDPRLKAKCPLKGALNLAELALRCLKQKAAKRPSMARVVDTLKNINENLGSSTEQNSRALEKRRDTVGGISCQDLEHRSNVVAQYLSMEGGSSLSASSRVGEPRAGSFVACALQTGMKSVENDKRPYTRSGVL